MPDEIERLGRWPNPGEPGRFRIRCSCQRWSFTGTVAEINDASRAHDDSPWHKHVVSIYGRLKEAPVPDRAILAAAVLAPGPVLAAGAAFTWRPAAMPMPPATCGTAHDCWRYL